MEKSPEEKKADAGWNDPPMLNYSHSNPPPKSRISNKRVAYPLFTNKEEKIQAATDTLSTLPVADSNQVASKESNIGWNSAEVLATSLNNFKKVLAESDLEQKQVINKMLENMSNMWQQNNINVTSQKLIFEMSQYLIQKDISNAEKCYSALATESGMQYGSWLIGIRHLISGVYVK